VAREGTALALAGRRLRCQGTEHARLGLLIVIAVAAGAFSVAYSATESRATDDRVVYAAGADLRAHYTSPSSRQALPTDVS